MPTYEFLSPFGFTETVVGNVIKALTASSGKQFFANNYYLIRDREYLFIYSCEQKAELPMVMIDENDSMIENPIVLYIQSFENTSSFKPMFDRYNAYFDNTDAGNYDLYLDAIRIYDPTGVISGEAENTTVENAYVADNEG